MSDSDWGYLHSNMKDKLLMFVEGLREISESDPSSVSIMNICNNIVQILLEFVIGALVHTPYLTPSSLSMEKDRLHHLFPLGRS